MRQKEQNSLQKKNLRLKLLKTKIAIRDFVLEQLWVYVIIVGSILLSAWLSNRWIEGTFFVVAHICIRREFEKQFHFSNTGYCLALTLTIIWLCIPITLPTSVSLLSSIPVAFIVCFFGWIAQDRIDKSKMFPVKQFDIKHLTKEQVLYICNELGYKKDKQDLAIMFFVEKLSNKQVWNILCNTQRNVEWDTVTKYKYRITKDFKEFIKYKE